MRNIKTALLIESDNPLRMILTLALEEDGYEVIAISSEKEAWEALKNLGPDQKLSCVAHNFSNTLYLSSIFLDSFLESCYELTGKKPNIISLSSIASDGLLDLNELNSALHQATAS